MIKTVSTVCQYIIIDRQNILQNHMNKGRFTNNGVERSCRSLAGNSHIVSQSEILSLAHTGLLGRTGEGKSHVYLLSEHMQKSEMCLFKSKKKNEMRYVPQVSSHAFF